MTVVNSRALATGFSSAKRDHARLYGEAKHAAMGGINKAALRNDGGGGSSVAMGIFHAAAEAAKESARAGGPPVNAQTLNDCIAEVGMAHPESRTKVGMRVYTWGSC